MPLQHSAARTLNGATGGRQYFKTDFSQVKLFKTVYSVFRFGLPAWWVFGSCPLGR